MSIDIEAGGALVTATLAASEADSLAGSKSSPSTASKAKTCANCKAPIAGRFCANCGQAAHVHRSLLHMIEEAVHGLLHFDSKSWRTFPLLVARPGLLTRRYIEGQRVKYVSPLALFLFTTFLMFFILSMIREPSNDLAKVKVGTSSEARAELVANLEKAKQKVAEQTAALAKLGNDASHDDAQEALVAATEEQNSAESALQAIDKVITLTPQQAADKGISDLDLTTGSAKFNDVFRRARENPQLMTYKLKNTAYKFSFMLIPISLPFLWLMFFWRRGVTLFDHTIFSLYSLSFMSLFFVVLGLMSMVPVVKSMAAYMLWLPPLHMFLQLRETYALGFLSTLWRTFALLIIAGTVFILFLILVVTITVM